MVILAIWDHNIGTYSLQYSIWEGSVFEACTGFYKASIKFFDIGLRFQTGRIRFRVCVTELQIKECLCSFGYSVGKL